MAYRIEVALHMSSILLIDSCKADRVLNNSKSRDDGAAISQHQILSDLHKKRLWGLPGIAPKEPI